LANTFTVPELHVSVFYICYGTFLLGNTHRYVGNAFHKRGPAIVTVNLRKCVL